MIEVIEVYTTEEERALALDYCWAQAAIKWKQRTGASLRDAQRMRWVFAQWAIRKGS